MEHTLAPKLVELKFTCAHFKWLRNKKIQQERTIPKMHKTARNTHSADGEIERL